MFSTVLFAVRAGQPKAWQVVLGIKIPVVPLSGANRTALAAWGAVAGVSLLAAAVLGLSLAG